LPHQLIEAFKATLEEVLEADLLVHVLDAAHPRLYERQKAVESVLKELNADERPMITALNKVDLLSEGQCLDRLKRDFINPVAISAELKTGLDSLLGKIQENFAGRMTELELLLPHSRMGLVDLFYREGKVKEIRYLQKGIKIKLGLPISLAQKLLNNKEIEQQDIK
ncbi:MAG TPA: GTPase HflX, partial [Candidatus Omnitrophota bacterium]|nr:GTPase HflX [Candidatus Omnitrophota bacterium]